MKHVLDAIHHFFLPKSSNNFRGKLLHHDFLTGYLIFALALTFGIAHLQNTSGSILGYATDITNAKLLELTNEKRGENNLPPLLQNDQLAAAASEKAQDMFAKDYWSHYGPSGETPWEFILGSGYQYEYAGENLAKNFLFSEGVVNAWMDSPTHRENILRSDYTDVGFAIVNGSLNGEETTLVVQMFGKPLASMAQSGDAPEKPEEVTAQKPVKATENYPSRVSAPIVLADTSSTPFYASYLNINLLFFSALILALILDFYFAAKLNLIHIKGKNLIHIMFIVFVMVGTFVIIKGSIL